MKYLSILFIALVTLVSCGGGDGADSEEGDAGAMTACDCAKAAVKVDMYDDAAIAAFEEEYAACEEVMTEDADYSACEDVMAELMGM